MRHTNPAAPTRKPRKRMAAEERRSLCLDRATRLFARKGFNGVTTSELARACKVSEALLFKLFQNKKGLYEALVRRMIEGPGDRIFARQEASVEDDRAFLSTMIREAILRTQENPAFFRLLLYSALDGDALSDIFYDAYSRKLHDFLSGYLRRRMDQGVFKRLDPRITALSILGMVGQYLQAMHVYRVPEFQQVRTEEIITTLVEVALGGLLVQPPGHRSTGSPESGSR